MAFPTPPLDSSILAYNPYFPNGVVSGDWATYFTALGNTIISGPVVSFNSRTGVVVPQTGDYSASQITGLPAFVASNGFYNSFGNDPTSTTGLVYGYIGGPAYVGVSWANIANGTVTLPSNSTCYVEHDAAGNVTANTIGFTYGGKFPMAKVVTGPSSITSITDFRIIPPDDRILSAQAQAQPLLAKLTANQENASIVVLGDSTGNDTNEWVYLLTQALAAKFPAYTVKYTLWDDPSLSYPAPTTIQTGSGSNTLTVYNGSVAGKTTIYDLGANFDPMVRSIQPDLIFVSHGHNQGTDPIQWAPDYLALTEALNLECGGAGIICVMQNPETTSNAQALRRTVYLQLAQRLGYGIVDIYQAFYDYGNWQADLMADTIHPNSAGQIVWVNQVLACFNYHRDAPIRARNSPLFAMGGAQIINNGSFSAWSGTLPDGWAAYNGSPVATKDSTNYESPNGYALNLTATGSAACSIAYLLPLNRVKGRWVTMVARIYVATGSPSTVGRVAIIDSTGTSTSQAEIYGMGAFRYIVMRRFISPSATSARVILYADSGTTNGNCTYDWVSVVVGDMPMGLGQSPWIPQSYPTAQSTTGTTVFYTWLPGDTTPRMVATSDGQLQFSGGSGAADVILKRSGAGTLSLTGALSTNAQAIFASFVSAKGFQQALNTKTTAYTATTADYGVAANATSAPFTVSFPSSPTSGQFYWVEKQDSTTNLVTLSGNGHNINGSANAYLPFPGDCYIAQYSSSDSQWYGYRVDSSYVGTAVASASTITPTGRIFHVSGTATITTINLPYTGFTGTIRIIPDGAFPTGTSGNIALASTAVVGRVLEMTYDGTKWYPSY